MVTGVQVCVCSALGQLNSEEEHTALTGCAMRAMRAGRREQESKRESKTEQEGEQGGRWR